MHEKGCLQMISNQVLQNTLEGLKEISRIEFCIIDTEGKVLASTFSDFSVQPGDVQAFVESQADSQLVKGFQILRCATIISWNIFWLPMVTTRTLIWLASWQRSRYRI